MRSSIHNVSVQFRANEHLLAAARAKAAREGMNFSEFVRSALRREVDRASLPTNPEPTSSSRLVTSVVSPNGALGQDAAEICVAVARGDITMQRALFRKMLEIIMAPDAHPLDAQYVAVNAIFVGRLLASHGVKQDIRLFTAALIQTSGILGKVGRHDIAEHILAEAVSILEQLAEDGDDLSAVCSQKLVATEGPHLPELVKTLRRNANVKEPV